MASNATFADILDVFFPTASESDGGEAIKMMIRPIMQRGMGLASEEAAHHQLGRTINEVSDWLSRMVSRPTRFAIRVSQC